MRRITSSLGLIASIVIAAPAAAQGQGQNPGGGPSDCRLRIETSTASWIIRGFDLFGTAQPISTFEVTFVNDGQAECRFRPVFDLNQEPFGLSEQRGRKIPYALVDLQGGYDATPLAGRSQRRQGSRPITIQAGGQQVVQYQLSVPLERIDGDGLFTQTVRVEAEQEDRSTIGGRQIMLGVEVLPAAVMGLAGAYRMSGGRALVELGELTEGVVQAPLQLRVTSTRRFKLDVGSQNNGFLRIQGTDWAVPYQLSVGGQSVGLTGGVAEVSGPPGDGLMRNSLPVQFRIGNPSGQRAGNYSDVLTISVSPM
jgi:hypothetical protein